MTPETIVQRFKQALRQKGWEPTEFADGYCDEDGQRYARFLNDFLQSLGESPWWIEMWWGEGMSELVVKRVIQPVNAFGLTTVEEGSFGHPLDGNDEEEAEERFLEMAERIIRLFAASNSTFKESEAA